jgi:O-antigen/teichoic acid export membrane protein
MLISLYTVRLVLNVLGVIDYGIFSVVGGIVVMFSFLSNTMASASQRFFAFEIGHNNISKLKKTFNMTIIIYAIISVIILVLAETVGLWFLNNKMVIPIQRLEAANWIYQFSVLSFIITILTIPYNALIIARENMKIYAFIGIIEVSFKLLIVYLLVLLVFDKLKLYAFLIFITTCLTSLMIGIFCSKKYKESKFQLYWDNKLFNTLISFSGWSLFGGIAAVVNNQGINILLNIFFGPVINAARAIAFQINSSVNQFVSNFTVAVNPQITKYYALDEGKEMLSLVFNSSKFSYFLILILSMPILLETNFIISFWLSNVPEYVVLFAQLIIINALIDSFSFSLQTAAQATGDIKKYQVVVGGMLLLNLPISFVFLKFGFLPQVTIYVSIVISIICLFLRLWMLKKLVNLSLKEYFKKVLLVAFLVTILSYIIPLLCLLNIDKSTTRFIIVGFTAIIGSTLMVYFIGISSKERFFLNNILRKKLALLTQKKT